MKIPLWRYLTSFLATVYPSNIGEKLSYNTFHFARIRSL